MTLLFALALGCSEYTVSEPPKVPPADPPGSDVDELGQAPDWASCYQGFQGTYANLDPSHPDVMPLEGEDTLHESPEGLDWWSDTVFTRFDNNLDFGEEWWPVDEDLEDDPAFFAVRWVAWMRNRGDGITFTLGGSDDVWVRFNREVVVSEPGLKDFAPQRHTIDPDNAQFPVEIFFAHRGSDSAAFRFRVVEGDVTICLPEYGEEE